MCPPHATGTGRPRRVRPPPARQVRRRATAVTAAAYLRGPALSVPWQPRPAPSRGGQRGSRFFVARRGAGTDPVSSCDAAELGIRGFSLVFFLPSSPPRPCPPSAGAQGRPRSRARVSGPTGCWQSGGGGGGAAGGAGSLGRAGRGGGLWHLTALPGGGGGGEGAAPRPAVCRALSPAPALAPVS